MKQTKEFFANKICEIFPDKKTALDEHYKDYGELLGHIFFADEINTPLINLLNYDTDIKIIKIYCSFIEDMWSNGNEDVVNIVCVTILEQLSDNKNIWNNMRKYISNDFIRYINTEVLIDNRAMWGVDKLKYH